ncbi:MAG: hypothetical protein HFH18_07940 [Ruminococcus sp.]|nr:hypothetical protein [Ruminococcus sp.]
MNNEAKNDFQIGVECFVEANRKYWEKTKEPASGDGWIYVLHTLHHEFTPSVLEDIVAKGVQEKEHLPIASVISGRADDLMELMDQVDASFGIEQRFHQSYYDYSNEVIEELAEKMASDTYGNKDGLIGLTYRGVRFGDSLYDDILRRGNNRKRGNIFDCFEISQGRYCKFIRNALAIIDQAYELFEKRKPSYLVTTEYFYTKGLYAHVACALGAKILITAVEYSDIIIQVDPNKHQLSDVKVADTKCAQIGICLQKYLDEDMYDENLFVREVKSNKKVSISQEWNGKKNVFILPHAFGDAPREAFRHNIYHDYREWFSDTLRIVRDIPGINWIVKDHPYSSYYGQEDYVRSVFEQYKTENLHWLDKEHSGMDIKDFADCILTCAGDAGIEYWAYGIPTITVCDTHYGRWGISYEIKSLNEYERVLKDIQSVNAPPQESVELARRWLNTSKNWHRQSDNFAKLIRKYYLEDEMIWKTSGVHYGIRDLVDQQLGKNVRGFCESFATLLSRNDLKSWPIFQLNNLVEI